MKETRYYIEKVAAGLRTLKKEEVPDYLVFAIINDDEKDFESLYKTETLLGLPLVFVNTYCTRESGCPFFLGYKNLYTSEIALCAERKFVEAYDNKEVTE